MKPATKRAALLTLTAAALAATWAATRHPRTAAPPAPPALRAGTQLLPALGAQSPLRFEENRGQGPAAAAFVAHGPGYHLALGSRGAKLTLAKPAAKVAHLAVRWIGANPSPAAIGDGTLAERHHYLVGGKSRWHTDVPTFARVRYREVYPGVDVVFYGNQRELEYDFLVAPGTDPSSIRLAFEGADAVRVTPNGDLELAVGGERVVQHAPRLYQETGGGRRPVEGGYVLAGGNAVAFRVAEHDRAKALVIDPVLRYASYLGGTGQDNVYAVAVDGQGNLYATGTTNSAGFPATGGAYDPSCNATTACATYKDAFVTKISGSTGSIVWSTFLGGDSSDQGNGIAVDSGGRVFVAGETASTNFPTTASNPINTQAIGSSSSFVAVLGAGGATLDYAAPVSDTGIVRLVGIGLDGSGNAWAGGLILPSTATKNACPLTDVAPGTASSFAGIVLKFAAAGTPGFSLCRLVTSTAGASETYGMTANASGAYLTGRRDTRAANGFDAFVARFDPSGALAYYTTLGGTGIDYGNAVAADASGNAYLAGYSTSTNFPATTGAYRTVAQGMEDGVVAKLDASGNLVYATYLGGSSTDDARAIAVDTDGTAVVAGNTYSGSGATRPFPVTANAAQATSSSSDAFVTRLDAAGGGLLFSSLLGGTGNVAGGEKAAGLALGPRGSIYVGGWTDSADFPVTRSAPHTPAAQGSFGTGTLDGFVARIVPGVNLAVSLSAMPAQPQVGESTTITVTVQNTTVANNVPASTTPAPDPASNVSVTVTPPTGVNVGSATASGGSCTGAGPFTCTFAGIASLGSATVSYPVTAASAGTFTASANAMADEFDPDTADNSASLALTVGGGGTFDGGGGGWDGGGCLPDCAGRFCGSDGCGGSCGTCNANQTCDAFGQCVGGNPNGCTPTCAGRSCGADGCGGLCGSCSGNQTCDGAGQCVDQGGGCFIATAAWGTPMAEDVRYLRAFRDAYLLPHAAGRAFVRAYYAASPPVAHAIRGRPILRGAVQAGLAPLVVLSRLAVEPGAAAAQTADKP